MPPVRIDASHFSPDTCAFIELLHSHRVRYLIVGGEAVIFHGHVRLTGDVDVFFANDSGNTDRVFAALEEFWDGDVPMSFIGLEALAKNKRATGRPKDLDDLSYLTGEL